MQEKSIYKRIVIKLSGEALSGEQKQGINPELVNFIADEVRKIYELDVQIGVVIGAGNLWRGSVGVQSGMDPVTADHMGMIGTVINALAIQDSLKRLGVPSRVQTAVQMNQITEPYIRLRALRHMEKGRVVVFGGGTGSPFFTTDSAASLRAREIEADIIIKATKVNGVYDDDPKKNPDAKRFEHLTMTEAINARVKVMDLTALAMCLEAKIPVIVLNFWEDGAMQRAVLGQPVGTYISPE